MSKLSKGGVHINAVTDEDAFVEFFRIAQPAVSLIIDHEDAYDFLMRAKQVSPNTSWVGRMYEKHQLLDKPVQRARGLFDRIRRSRIYRMVKVWAGYNEIAGYPYRPNPGHEMILRLLEFEWELACLLNGDGSAFGEGSWSVGNPDLKWWGDPAMVDVLRVSKALLLHEYYAPTMFHPSQFDPVPGSLETYIESGWYMLRYRKIPKDVLKWCPPIIITECGIDAGAPRDDLKASLGILGKSAWRDIGASMSHDPVKWYLDQIKWADKQYQRDARVQGFCIYCLGTHDPKWDPFDLKGPMLSAYGRYVGSSHPIAPPPVAPGDVMGQLMHWAEPSVIPMVPGHALFDAILRDGLMPCSEEGRTVLEGVRYAWQWGYDATRNRRWLYACAEGDWGSIEKRERPN